MLLVLALDPVIIPLGSRMNLDLIPLCKLVLTG